jgi:hypothetical protein
MVKDDDLREDFEYSLSTPWDITSASEVDYFAPTGGATSTRGVFVRSDGSQLFVTDNGSDELYEYGKTSFDGTAYASVQME